MTEPTYDRYIAAPRSGKGAGVLVLHAWWGLNDFFRGLCDRLAREGFVALAPDMMSGRVARTVLEAEQLLSQSNEEQVVPPIVLSAAEALRSHPAVSGNGLGVIGFSMGGYWALWLAEQKPDVVRAVTVFYATGEGDFQRSQAAFLGHFAETDPYEPAAAVMELEKTLKAANRPANFYTYPGTSHWFFENDRAEAYNARAAQLAWDRTIALLHGQLDGSAS